MVRKRYVVLAVFLHYGVLIYSSVVGRSLYVEWYLLRRSTLVGIHGVPMKHDVFLHNPAHTCCDFLWSPFHRRRMYHVPARFSFKSRVRSS